MVQCIVRRRGHLHRPETGHLHSPEACPSTFVGCTFTLHCPCSFALSPTLSGDMFCETCSNAVSGDLVICVVWIHVHLRCPETFLSSFSCRCMFILHCPETRSFILRRHVHLLCPEMCSSYGLRTWSSAYLKACAYALCGGMFLCIAWRYFIRIMQPCPSTLSEGMFICLVRRNVHLHCPEACSFALSGDMPI